MCDTCVTQDMDECAAEHITASILMSHLFAALGLNHRAAQQQSLEAFCEAEGIIGDHLSPLYYPESPRCDVQLLRAMYQRQFVSGSNASLVKLRWELLHMVMEGWRGDGASKPHMPFPSPTARDQVRGVYIAAYHSCDDLLLWMEQQRWCLDMAEPDVDGPPRLALGVVPVLTKVFTNEVVRSGLADLDLKLEAATLGGWMGLRAAVCPYLT